MNEAESRLGIVFPLAFVERMMQSNGGDVVVEGEEWSLHPFLDRSDTVRLKRTCNDIVRETIGAREWTGFPPAAVAIASNGMGDQLVLVPDPLDRRQLQPGIFMWSHESGELDLVAKDFGELSRGRSRP